MVQSIRFFFGSKPATMFDIHTSPICLLFLHAYYSRKFHCTNATFAKVAENVILNINLDKVSILHEAAILVLWHCGLGDRKGNPALKSCVLLVDGHDLVEALHVLFTPVVTTTSIILTSRNIQIFWRYSAIGFRGYPGEWPLTGVVVSSHCKMRPNTTSRSPHSHFLHTSVQVSSR